MHTDAGHVTHRRHDSTPVTPASRGGAPLRQGPQNLRSRCANVGAPPPFRPSPRPPSLREAPGRLRPGRGRHNQLRGTPPCPRQRGFAPSTGSGQALCTPLAGHAPGMQGPYGRGGPPAGPRRGACPQHRCVPAPSPARLLWAKLEVCASPGGRRASSEPSEVARRLHTATASRSA